MRPWWKKRSENGGHAAPSLERESAMVVGRLDELCDQLEQILSEADQITGELDLEAVRRKRDEQ